MATRASRFHRGEFDRNRDFIITRNIVLGGKIVGSGPLLDEVKAQFTTRRLRQLWEQRAVDMVPVDPAALSIRPRRGTNATVAKPQHQEPVKVIEQPKKSPMPEFDQMSAVMLRVWFKEQGVTITNKNATRADLIRKAKAVAGDKRDVDGNKKTEEQRDGVAA